MKFQLLDKLWMDFHQSLGRVGSISGDFLWTRVSITTGESGNGFTKVAASGCFSMVEFIALRCLHCFDTVD